MRIGSVLVPVLVLAAARPARAQASATDKALAESLFQEARRLMKSGKVEDACPKLAESNRLVPKLGTLLNLATCHAQQGKTATAWAEFTQAESLAANAKQSERAQYAHKEAQELQKRLSYLVIEAGGADGDRAVTIDGEAVSSKAVLNTPLSVDPGSHEIVVTAPGKKPWTTTVKVEPGPATARVKLPALEVDVAAPVPAAAPPSATPPPPPVAEGRGNAQRIAGIAMTVTGAAAGLAVGIGFGARTFFSESDSNAHCKGILCDQMGVDDRQSARTSGTVSTIAFVAGGALVAGGVALILTAPASPKAQAFWLAPQVGVGRSGLVLGGAF
jgi:hypothetical protein